MAILDKTQLPQPVGITASLPTRYSTAPDKLIKAFPDFVSYHATNERLYKALRQAWIDSTDDIVLSMNKGDVGNAGNILAIQNDLRAQIRNEQSARIDGDTALATAISTLTAGSGTTSTIFVQSTTPVALLVNDIWINPSAGFAIKYWNGSAWVDATDQRLFDAIAAISHESSASASRDAAMALDITALFSTTGTNTANIVTILSTYATQTFATAKKTEAITASGTYTDGAVSASASTITTAYVAADTALSNRIDALTAAAGQHIFVQATPPIALAVNDLWLDSSNGKRPYYWDGGAWTDATDTRLVGALATITTISSTYASTSFVSSSIATSASATLASSFTYTDGRIASLSSIYVTPTSVAASITTAISSEVSNRNTAISASASFLTSAYTAADSALNTALSGTISSLSSTVSLKNTTFRQNTVPTALVVGDIWIDTGNGNALKRWNGSLWVDTTVASGAISTSATAVTAAYTAADAALNTALSGTITTLTATVNLKNTVYRQGTAPSSPVLGDTWIDTASGNALKWWNGSAWVDTTVGSAAIAAAVSSEATARASDVAAEASTRSLAISTLTTNLGIVSSSLSIETSARVTADGFLSAKYTLTAAAGDVITGLNITSSTGAGTNVSVVAFQADRFQINTSSGGNKQIFSATASAVKLGDVLTVDLAGAKMFIGTGTFGNSNTGFYVDSSGQFSLKDKLTWDGTTLSINGNGTFSGALSGATGTFSGTLDVGSGQSHVHISTSGVVVGYGSNNFFQVTDGGTSDTAATWLADNAGTSVSAVEISAHNTGGGGGGTPAYGRLQVFSANGGNQFELSLNRLSFYNGSTFDNLDFLGGGLAYSSGGAGTFTAYDLVGSHSVSSSGLISTTGSMTASGDTTAARLFSADIGINDVLFKRVSDGLTPTLYTGDLSVGGHFFRFGVVSGEPHIFVDGVDLGAFTLH